ncbi:M90 family metallopeptidase [Sulfurovum sp.]|jgi:Mlc titration factor MtfA (ptsG expression regulator)|uniref:M90 family metallopeptidase n=1 Tax=Sulfurovum sp. TaxID=1969726 RepID=UPI002A36C293|nr:M90 family metallopeptidase [Sulfurovum sp.]MDY0402267.1 zinc-dependent peptidase [Sulfurovum sp.]
MAYYLILMQFFLALIALFLFWKSIEYFVGMWRYKKFKTMPLPQNYRETLLSLPHYLDLPGDLREKIRTRILLFIDQKEFVSAQMEITEEIKVIIAFYASLVRLGFELDEHDKVATIIVYPEDFVVDRSSTHNGIHTNRSSLLSGESANRTVVLSWQDIRHHIVSGSKENVIIHEFAHELDFEDGMPDGTPELDTFSAYPRYAQVFSNAFIILTKQVKRNLITEQAAFLGSYALENEAEFFAVCSERFFMAPHTLKRVLPDIYEELHRFYRLDTALMFKAP